MLLALIAALLLGPARAADPPPQSAQPVDVSLVAADLHPDRYEQFPTYDTEAERELLQLTNRERERVGAPPLRLDESLTAAARTHSAAMAAGRELSHQLTGEPPLDQRLAKSPLHLANAGENVAWDVNIEQAHEGLMHSPHHRENLLRADYNVVGLGVARIGDRLYVTEDFGHSLPVYSVEQAENIVAAGLARARGQASHSQLRRLQLGSLRQATCSMAKQDQLNPKAIRDLGPLHYILTYTNMQPDLLPASAGKVMDDANVRSFAVGACFAHTPKYPNGAYWVTVAFY